jgi:myo-inositol 2-dehydrogenase/D-chiro-inositol 1-dehydrogenase
MNGPLRVGIAGIGRMGQRHAMNLAHRTLGAQLVAACSPVAGELEWVRGKLGVKPLYRDYKDLLAHPGLDAVFLVTTDAIGGQ